MNGDRNMNDIVEDPILIEVIRSLENVKTELQTNRTFKLWLQNMDMTDTLQQFFKSRAYRKMGITPKLSNLSLKYATILGCWWT